MSQDQRDDRELTSRRKDEHLSACLDDNVESLSGAGWERVKLPHCALPELNFDEINTQVKVFGHTLSSPIFISSMTGGTPKADAINETLAQFAESKEIAMGLGSQRVLLENRDSRSFSLRKVAPKAVLFANIGAVQLNYGVSVADCQWLVDQTEAQALILHCNPLQECIQAEGDKDFRNLFAKIAELKKSLNCPLILKETGCGLDETTCRRAIEAGVDALDTAGMGGSHWGFIEGLRNENRFELGAQFRDWGIPSLEALQIAVECSRGQLPVFASGGIRSGLDVARALFTGGTLAGMALPFLKAADEGLESLESFYLQELEALKIAMMVSSHPNVESFRKQSHDQ